MLHQTLLPFQPFSSSFSHLSTLPSASFSGGSSSSTTPLSAGRPLSPSPPHARASQVEMKLMDMLSSAREQGFLAGDIEEVAWIGERDNLLAEDFQVDDLLDLRGLPESEEESEVPKITEAPNHKHSFSPLKTFPCADIEKSERLELYSEITLNETDAASLEWLSTFFDDCAKEFPCSPPSLPAPSLFSTAAAAGSLSTESLVPIKAKRSKRLRKSRALWSLSGSFKLADSSPSSSLTSCSPTPSSSSSSSSFNSYFHDLPPFTGFTMEGSLVLCKGQKLKKRGRKPKNPFLSPGERRCSHCGVHKTPQWRAGPQGAKTLCNACGVRYKSGRLLPEYRPACSPSFVSNIHSNSHRKVLEMRRKKDEQLVVIAAPPVRFC